MADFADLTVYSYGDSPIPMKNIGWLGRSFGVPTGEGGVNSQALARLEFEIRKPRSLALGVHECEFCRSNPPVTGNGEIHIFGTDGTTYSTPTMIVHYIRDHAYSPPSEFVSALLREVPLEWDERAVAFSHMLQEPESDPAWKVNALLDLPNWSDPRAYQAALNATRDQELREIADYELGVTLGEFWAQVNKVDDQVYQGLDSLTQQYAIEAFCKMIQVARKSGNPEAP
ncbi:DUF7919 family protein [Streptomyces griseochromogenes]|uniref:DUF7919 family protein n=1 Tax=Streptomyces griseochromogenes TaxID=68214 RepID=UPI003FD8FD42